MDILNELVVLEQERQSLEQQIQQLELVQGYLAIKQKIADFTAKAIEAIESGEMESGKRVGTLPNGDKIEIYGKKGAKRVQVVDIDKLPEMYRKDEEAQNAVAVDGSIFIEAPEGYYVRGGVVYKKVANEDLVKATAKLGVEIDGVEVKQNRASVSVKVNGEKIN